MTGMARVRKLQKTAVGTNGAIDLSVKYSTCSVSAGNSVSVESIAEDFKKDQSAVANAVVEDEN